LAIIPESEDEPFFLEDEMPNTLVDKRAAAQWARELLAGEFVIVDTETTGFEVTDEVIQIGVIDHTGAVVLDTLIRPTQPIRNSQYHHITDDTVKDAPTFPDAYVRIKAAVEGKRILAYNTSYDTRMLNQVCAKHGLELFIWVQPGCVMEQYAEFHGEWNDYHGNYRWQKLRQAVTQMGLEFEGSEHNAVADCRATLALLRAMAAFEAVPMG
jgi:DNA polymerase-3 subunit epsilon